MIVIYQNNQITAVDKKLLQILNCSLTDLSEKISQVDLALNSIQNSQITIENQNFNVKEISLVNIDDLHIYELEAKTKNNELSLENIFSTQIKPIEETKKQEISELPSLEHSFEINPIEEIPENIPTKEEPSQTIQPLELEIEKEPKEISITFEDEFGEIEKILSLNEKEAKKLILEDLEKASNDFEMDLESIKELYNDLINQIETSKDAFYNAIKTKDYEEMHKISHSLKGASLNLRISNMAIILKTIDEKSKEKISFDKLEFLVNNFYAFVKKVENLETKTNISKEPENKKEIPDFLKTLILETIKNYLSTQNEKKLKKDLKYIKKLLNVKINSIEELQEIIKAEK